MHYKIIKESPQSKDDGVASTDGRLVRAVEEQLGVEFTIDVAALPENAKCPTYYTPQEDGLCQDWSGHTVWLNPPFADAAKWLEKAFKEGQQGTSVVCLLPWLKGADWWEAFVLKGKRLDIQGKVRFQGHTTSFAKDVVLIIFGPLAGEESVAIIKQDRSLPPLTKSQEKRLVELEDRIADSQESIGEALCELKRSKLYKRTHSRWAAYVEEHPRFGFGADWADDLIAFVEVAEKIGRLSEFPAPKNPAQARPLATLDDDQLVKVWRAVQESGRPVTEGLIRQCVSGMQPVPEDAEADDQALPDDQVPLDDRAPLDDLALLESEELGSEGVDAATSHIFFADIWDQPAIRQCEVVGESASEYHYLDDEDGIETISKGLEGDAYFLTEEDARLGLYGQCREYLHELLEATAEFDPLDEPPSGWIPAGYIILLQEFGRAIGGTDALRRALEEVVELEAAQAACEECSPAR